MTTTSVSRPESAGIAWAPLIWVGLMHVGALLALVPACFSWSAVGVGIFLYWLTASVGVCLTYHRLLTHRSFATRPRLLEYILTPIGCCASQGGAIGWVADHRKHHAHSDDEEDVHSPNRGFAWAHMLWWMTPDVTALHTVDYYRKWAPDLERDPVHRVLDSMHLVFPVLLFLGLYLVGGLPWLVWGGFVRTVAVLHSTWLVNSATHIWGYRTYPTRDTSTNLWWVALLTFGEGWHNNHHAFPPSARHGLRWWEFDATYWTIRLLRVVGLVRGVKLPKTTPAGPSGRQKPCPARRLPSGGTPRPGPVRTTGRLCRLRSRCMPARKTPVPGRLQTTAEGVQRGRKGISDWIATFLLVSTKWKWGNATPGLW